MVIEEQDSKDTQCPRSPAQRTFIKKRSLGCGWQLVVVAN